MPTPRLNWVLFIGYTIATAGVFVAALFVPQFRSLAYAPLRELLLPPPQPVVVSVLYSTEKEAWLKEAILRFEAADRRVDGRPIKIEIEKSGSREIYLAVLDGKARPDIISPASSLQISLLESLAVNKFPTPIIDRRDARTCRSVFTTPLVLVAWRERAEVLWGAAPPADLWNLLHTAVVDSRGWEAFGRPEWGYLKFGHTDPTKSNSGFMAILLMTYAYFQKTDGLTSQDMLSTAAYQEWLTSFESSVSDFGDSTGTYMRDIVAYGPSKYDIVAVYEATAIEQLENAKGRYGELFLYYPPATSVSDHPFCVLQAEWVTDQKKRAAQTFIAFLLERPIQELALSPYGFRPADPGVALDQPGSPFTRYAGNGLQTNIPPQVAIPDGAVLDTLLTFWIREIQR
jgi:ABC-type Fe3+ transport system substrate-binding protein